MTRRPTTDSVVFKGTNRKPFPFWGGSDFFDTDRSAELANLIP